jgi:hypothetical protein
MEGPLCGDPPNLRPTSSLHPNFGNEAGGLQLGKGAIGDFDARMPTE